MGDVPAVPGIPADAQGRPVYRASYALGGTGCWEISIQTEAGAVHAQAQRLVDIERRAYWAVQMAVGRPIGSFDVTFAHEVDLTEPTTIST